MDAKTQSLKQNIEELQQQIAAEEGKTEQLKKRISNSTGEAQVKQEKLLKQLNEKVRWPTNVIPSIMFHAGGVYSSLSSLLLLKPSF